MRTFYIFLLILWYALGWVWSKKTFCGEEANAAVSAATPAKTECISTLVFKEKNGVIDLSSSENFQFMKSSHNIEVPSSDLASVIEKVTLYLSDNSDRFLQITGLYLPTEENTSDYDNLGEARANSVKSYLVSKGANAQQLQTVGKSTDAACNTDEKITKGVTAAFGSIPQ